MIPHGSDNIFNAARSPSVVHQEEGLHLHERDSRCWRPVSGVTTSEISEAYYSFVMPRACEIGDLLALQCFFAARQSGNGRVIRWRPSIWVQVHWLGEVSIEVVG